MPPDPLRQTAQDRLATLRTELANGRDALTQLEQRRVQIADTLLRIEGAIQVLDEVLATPEPAQPSADGDPRLAHLHDNILPKMAGSLQVLEDLLGSATRAVMAGDDVKEETTICQSPNGEECMPLPSV